MDVDDKELRREGLFQTTYWLLVTNKRPDILIVDDLQKILAVFELVVPLDNVKGRRNKEESYQELFTKKRKKIIGTYQVYQVLFRPFAVG